MMGVVYYAYGSNMDFKRLEERGISFEFMGVGILENYELQFNKIAKNKTGIGYANVVKKQGSNVEGLLFSVDNIHILDRYEGFPEHYLKENLTICFLNDLIEAIVYVAAPDKIGMNLMPEKVYLNRLLAAKEYLSQEYFDFLDSTKTID
jgi:gamma-glutamylcyclotransferase